MTKSRSEMKKTPKVRGERPRRSVTLFLLPHFSAGGSRRRRQIWIGNRRPRLTIRRYQLLATLSRRGKKMLCKSVFVAAVVHGGRRRRRGRWCWVLRCVLVAKRTSSTRRRAYQRRDLGYPGDDDGKSEGVEARRVLLVAKTPRIHCTLGQIHARRRRGQGTSQGNNTDSLVGLPRKVIAAARLH